MSHGQFPGIHRIVLVGFMAAGKTTIGRRLAATLGWDFLDFDDVIREREGRSSGALIRERGEAAFRELEVRLTDDCRARTGLVIAPGGGWGARPELAERLGPGTVRVWLRVAVAEALRRAGAEGVDRPLLGPERGRVQRAAALLAEREPGYAAAEIVVEVEGKEPDVVVSEILRLLPGEAGEG